MILDGNGFLLRNLREEDLPHLTLYANNRNIFLNVRDNFPSPYLESDARLFVKKNQFSENIFAIVKDHFIGMIAYIPQTDVNCHTAEIGYWLAEPFWNQGIMSQAIQVLSEFVLKNIEIKKLYAGVFEGNLSSMRALEKAGFSLEAVLRKNVLKNKCYLDEYRFVRFGFL